MRRLFTLLSILAATAYSADSTATATALPPALSTLNLTSTPDSAQVVVGDSTYGITPCTITIPAGDVKFALKKKGYYLKSAAVTMTPGETRSLAFELAAPGRIVITTSPAEADVLVDGKAVGLSPVIADKLKPGEHVVDISRAGFRPVSKTVTLANGATDSLTIVLEAPPAVTTEQTPAAVAPPPASQPSPVASPASLEKKPAPVSTPATPAVAKEKNSDDKKAKKILDKVAIGVFALFSLIILGVELAQNK